MKTCTKCKETKAFSEFHKDKSKKDGLQSSCKQCKREAVAGYRASNREKECEYSRKYRASNRDKVREKDLKWKKDNPERVKSYKHARRAREVNLYGGEPDHARIAEWMQLTKDDACRWCGTTEFPDGYHWDHVVPLSLGGPHEFWNLVKACAACNLRKNAKLPQEVGFI